MRRKQLGSIGSRLGAKTWWILVQANRTKLKGRYGIYKRKLIEKEGGSHRRSSVYIADGLYITILRILDELSPMLTWGEMVLNMGIVVWTDAIALLPWRYKFYLYISTTVTNHSLRTMAPLQKCQEAVKKHLLADKLLETARDTTPYTLEIFFTYRPPYFRWLSLLLCLLRQVKVSGDLFGGNTTYKMGIITLQKGK